MDIALFVANYSEADRTRIEFSWNQMHASEFVDGNRAFRSAVVSHCVSHPSSAPVVLLEHLFLAEAACAKEAWGTSLEFGDLAQVLLDRGGLEVLDSFSTGFIKSFDTFAACHGISLSPPLLAQLSEAARARLLDAVTPQETVSAESLVELFEKLSKGTASQGWFVVKPGAPVSGVRVVSPGWFSRLLSRLQLGRSAS